MPQDALSGTGFAGARGRYLILNGKDERNRILPWLAIAVLFMLLRPDKVNAATFYIDSRAGNDSNSGSSESSPWRTLSRINSVQLSSGDSIYLRRGSTWRETLVPRGSGVQGAPVTITAYGSGDPPTINGSDLVSGWTPSSESVYRAPLAAKPTNVYLDNASGWGLNPSGSQSSIQANSWYWDGQSIFLKLADGSDPGRHTVEAVVRPQAVQAHNESYLIVDHLRTMRTGCWAIEMLSESPERNVGSVISNNIVTQNGTNLIDTGSYCNAIYINYATSPTVRGNVVSYAGGHNAINVQKATNIVILNNDVSEWKHNGLDTKMSKGVLYQGNTAHDAPAGNGIYSEVTSDITVQGNTIYNIGGNANGNSNGVHIGIKTGGQILIAHNSIRNTFGGIYLRAPATTDSNSITTRSGLTLTQR